MRKKMQSKQHLLSLVGLLALSFCQGSIYPAGEDKEAWDARINGQIDTLHKRDVTVKVALTQEELVKHKAGKLRLRVNQTASPIPFGTYLCIISTRSNSKSTLDN